MVDARVHKLITRAKQRVADQARHARTALAALPLESLPDYEREFVLGRLEEIIDDGSARSGSPWSFTMLNMDQVTYVWDAIRALPPEDRPNQVRHAFDIALAHLRWNGGEITLRRDEIAAKIGCAPRSVSTVMSVLVRIGAITREYRRVEGMSGPGVVVYRINPNVGWRGDQAARSRAVEEAPGPLLTLMEGGKVEA